MTFSPSTNPGPVVRTTVRGGEVEHRQNLRGGRHVSRPTRKYAADRTDAGRPLNYAYAVHGVLDTDLIEIVRDRLTAFQAGPYACRENACALTHIEEALLWMNKRVEDRITRGVLGTYEK